MFERISDCVFPEESSFTVPETMHILVPPIGCPAGQYGGAMKGKCLQVQKLGHMKQNISRVCSSFLMVLKLHYEVLSVETLCLLCSSVGSRQKGRRRRVTIVERFPEKKKH